MAFDAEIKTRVSYDTKDSEKNVNKLSGSLKNLASAAAIAFATKKIVDFSKAAIEAANIQIEAETKLETVLKSRLKATDDQIQAMKDLASETQKVGVIGDEVIISGQQQLATFLRSTDALAILTPAMADLAAQQNGVNASSQDLVGIANLMGKVMDGQASALTRVGITLTEVQKETIKTGDEMERAAVLAQIIEDNVGNMNEALAATDAGQIQQMKNEMGDLQEEIGKQLLPVALSLAKAFAAIVKPLVEFLVNNKLIVPLLGVLTVVLAALAVNLGIATLSMWGFNAAMLANPIGLVIAAIGLLVAAGIFLIKNWDQVSDFFSNLWNEIQDIFKAGINGIINILNLLPKLWELEINLVLDGLNFLIEQLNKIPGVDIESVGHVSLPRIPKLAKGGLAFGETQAIVGDNPNASVDPEVIAPLSKLQDIMGGNNGNQTVQLVVDGRILGEAVLNRTNAIMAGGFGVKIN